MADDREDRCALADEINSGPTPKEVPERLLCADGWPCPKCGRHERRCICHRKGTQVIKRDHGDLVITESADGEIIIEG